MIKYSPVCALSAFLTLLFATTVAAQGEETYYYRFDQKIAGHLDKSILAVWVPPSTDRQTFSAAFESASEQYLSEDLPYVKAFGQEGVVFVKLDEIPNADAFLSYQNSFQAVSSEAQVGHPFFLEDEELPMIVTSDFIVRFKSEVTTERIAEFNEAQQVKTLEANPHVENQFLLRSAGGTNALDMANRYQESGLAEFAHPNFLVHIEYNHTPTDPDYGLQWHLSNAGGGGMTADADIDADDAWDYEMGEPTVVVAVIDGGFEINHDDLDDQFITNAGEIDGNGIDDDGNGYIDDVNGWSFVDDSDDVGVGLWTYHGQSVAGLVAAEENNLMVVGVCPDCSLLLIANTFNINDLANAFYYARDRGAWAITNSWGSTGSTFDQPALNTALADVATNGRGGLGIPIFFATGNDGGAVVAYPARDPNTIAVGGADCNNVRYTGSQYGPEIDFLSTTRQGDGTCGLVTTNLGNATGTTFGGTSGATPVAAGIGGLLLSLEPALTGTEVRDILRQTAEKIDSTSAAYDADGWSNTHGYGRVNAHRAVVPTVKISVSPETVERNQPFDVTVTGSAPFGLTAVWWFGQGTGIPDIDTAHWHNVTGAEPVYTRTWTGVTISQRGTFTLAANARDVQYPNPGDGYPHQASEGSGIDTTQIRVTPLGSKLGLLMLGMMFAMSGRAFTRSA
jgi:subtilisin family serine protease